MVVDGWVNIFPEAFASKWVAQEENQGVRQLFGEDLAKGRTVEGLIEAMDDAGIATGVLTSGLSDPERSHRLGGYAADLTRTIWVGEPTERLRAVYNVVDAAQRAELGALRAGVLGKDVDAVAREVIAAAGHGDHFSHGVRSGHGLGIRVHEAPSLGKTSDDVLLPGQVLTVEPGVYIADWGGVRIEDVGVVEADGFRLLTGAPKPLP